MSRYLSLSSSLATRFIRKQLGPFPSRQLQQATRTMASSSRPDPFARRPNQKCDPYGQGGKALVLEDAKRLLDTVSDEWKLIDDNTAISRDFVHPDFITGSSFLTHMAAVAQINDHFPSLTLERRLDSRKKAWHVVSTVTCSTKVLQGLSHHDFFLATVSIKICSPTKNLISP